MTLPPIRVLLVEDNPGDAALARQALTDAGHFPFTVIEVDHLAAALRHLTADVFDVILLDLLLPDAEGLDALAAVRGQAPAAPVVVLTGLEDEALALGALRQGAQDYVPKGPFQPGTLARAVRHAIERQRLEQALRQAREELERRVQERTAELARANESLRVEVAERRRAEEALRQSERRLCLVLERMPAILWTTDMELRVTFSAGAGLAALNVTPEQVVGRTILEYFGTADRTFYPIAAHERALGGESGSYELEWQGRVFRTHLEPLRDGAGQTVGCIGVTLDVTAHRRAEAERHELEARLAQAQKLESLGTLAGGLAHDFNNLLTGILGNASSALMDLASESRAHSAVQQVEEAALRAAELTRQLLAYSGRGKLAVTPVNLSRLIEDMAALLQSLIARNGHLRFELAANLPSVQADTGQIRQVVLNLIANAAEALDNKNGDVGVRTGVMHAERADLATTHVTEELPPGQYAFLEVSDTGCGMDEAMLKRLFDPFFTTKFTGRGLGLAAVLGIVRGHRGAIKVSSAPNRGSAFKVLLPCADLAP